MKMCLRRSEVAAAAAVFLLFLLCDVTVCFRIRQCDYMGCCFNIQRTNVTCNFSSPVRIPTHRIMARMVRMRVEARQSRLDLFFIVVLT